MLQNKANHPLLSKAKIYFFLIGQETDEREDRGRWNNMRQTSPGWNQIQFIADFTMWSTFVPLLTKHKSNCKIRQCRSSMNRNSVFSIQYFIALFSCKTRKLMARWLPFCVLLWNTGSCIWDQTVKRGSADKIWIRTISLLKRFQKQILAYCLVIIFNMRTFYRPPCWKWSGRGNRGTYMHEHAHTAGPSTKTNTQGVWHRSVFRTSVLKSIFTVCCYINVQ